MYVYVNTFYTHSSYLIIHEEDIPNVPLPLHGSSCVRGSMGRIISHSTSPNHQMGYSFSRIDWLVTWPP